MKWGPIHPDESAWRWEPADWLVEYARAHDMLVHGHALVWQRATPGLDLRRRATTVPRDVRGTPPDARRPLPRSGRILGRRERGADESGTLARHDLPESAGPRLHRGGLPIAHAADPDTRLYYNDPSAPTGSAGSRTPCTPSCVACSDDDVPIHGVGLQMHLDAASPPAAADVAANVERLSALGLDVRISEMDVRVRSDPRA